MKKYLPCCMLLLFISVSCGTSSYITGYRKAEDVQTKKYKKIVVLGLIRDDDLAVRQKMEKHMVDDLKALGYDAVCSCDEYNLKAFDGLNEQQALAKLRNAGVDAALTVVLLDKKKESYYVSERFNYNYIPSSGSDGHFWDYYHTMRDRVFSEGYYVVNTKYFWESNFYDVEKDRLLYSAQSQSFDPATTEAMAHEYGQKIIKNMVRHKVLGVQLQEKLKPM